ncbi:calcium-binding protein E63-1 isoform X3 [Schistocerca gregaria]|uniref:calcium-binding protein E63-1 isoform X3 n=1 Tax=Schistocerca gregaria TaxID=7010 RepID=UPI00211E4F26|nr:calcium-binding protein E63-1 isoform X3 [Schistocerca gregaria]
MICRYPSEHRRQSLSAMAHRKRSLPRQDSLPKREFTEEELKDLRTAFGLLDRNRDGRVTASELQFMLTNLGIPVSDDIIEQLVKDAGRSENGLINEAEFLQWVARIQALTQDTEGDDDVTKDLIAAFRVFDRDCNGYITKDELKSAMDMIGETVTEGDLNEMLAMADVDRDGRINYEEFARLLL